MCQQILSDREKAKRKNTALLAQKLIGRRKDDSGGRIFFVFSLRRKYIPVPASFRVKQRSQRQQRPFWLSLGLQGRTLPLSPLLAPTGFYVSKRCPFSLLPWPQEKLSPRQISISLNELLTLHTALLVASSERPALARAGAAARHHTKSR